MGSIYKGSWPIKDTSVDFIIELEEEQKEISNIKVDSIWVDLSQGLNLIKSGSISMSMISKLWTVNSTSFCPILEFMAEAAFSNPEYYQVCLESLVLKALLPTGIEPNELFELDHDDIRECNLDSPQIFLEKSEMFDEDQEISDEISPKISLLKSIPFNKPKKEMCTIAVEKRVKVEDLSADDLDNLDKQDVEGIIKEDITVVMPHITVTERAEIINIPANMRTCSICDKRFAGDMRLYNHFIVTHPQEQALWPARPESDTQFQECSVCQKLFDNLYTYKHHTRNCGRKTKEYLCPICNTVFTTKKRCYRHCQIKHKNQKSLWPKLCTSLAARKTRMCDLMERTDLNCGFCKLPLNNYFGLVRHERNHADAFICVICGIPCLKLDKLIEHMDSKHEDKNKYMCKECGFFGYDEKSLRVHNNNTHQKDSIEYKCTECTFTTCVQSTYQNHVRVHKQDDPEPGKMYVCDECGKEFPTYSKIRNHKQSHKAEINSIYSCTYCGKTFHQISVLNIHQRVHTGEKPYECQDCPQKFGSKSSLIKHKENLHTSFEDMPYKCLECKKGFSKSRRKIYLGHMKQHSGIKEHGCPICSATFACRAYLGNHFRKVHKGKLSEVESENITFVSSPETNIPFTDPDNQITISIV